jgi:hypothetical protein
MERSATPTQVTDLHGLAPAARHCIRAALEPLIGAAELTYDFYREWSGGWRCRVAVAGRARSQLDFVLFHTPPGGLLAVPIPLPERLRAGPGVRASDGSLWMLDADGRVVPANG